MGPQGHSLCLCWPLVFPGCGDVPVVVILGNFLSRLGVIASPSTRSCLDPNLRAVWRSGPAETEGVSTVGGELVQARLRLAGGSPGNGPPSTQSCLDSMSGLNLCVVLCGGMTRRDIFSLGLLHVSSATLSVLDCGWSVVCLLVCGLFDGLWCVCCGCVVLLDLWG
jgi:hypothetical protein